MQQTQAGRPTEPQQHWLWRTRAGCRAPHRVSCCSSGMQLLQRHSRRCHKMPHSSMAEHGSMCVVQRHTHGAGSLSYALQAALVVPSGLEMLPLLVRLGPPNAAVGSGTMQCGWLFFQRSHPRPSHVLSWPPLQYAVGEMHAWVGRACGSHCLHH